MIKTETIKINRIKELDNFYIESIISELRIVPIRWAIVGVAEDCLFVSVSYRE